ncbi:outer membrane protein assembly factor BamE [Candidatus Pelagibacter sp.]|nr:outer membrane protein assembly factor BamE [Candidatus Pelagibacter sp.]
MKKIFLFFIGFFISNCSLNEVSKHHGVLFLDKKQEKLFINATNKNDIIEILGPPSTKSTFNNDVWIYIERKTSKGSLLTFGRNKLITNNILILEINNRGLLAKKDFLDINDMNELKFSKDTTEIVYSKKSFIYDFLSSMRQKINDPLGKRKERRQKK